MHILSIILSILLGLFLIALVVRNSDNELFIGVSLTVFIILFLVAIPTYLSTKETSRLVVDSRVDEPISERTINEQTIRVFSFQGKPLPFTNERFLLNTFKEKMDHSHIPDIRIEKNGNDSIAYVYSLRVLSPLGLIKRHEFVVSNEKVPSFEVALSMNEIKQETEK